MHDVGPVDQAALPKISSAHPPDHQLADIYGEAGGKGNGGKGTFPQGEDDRNRKSQGCGNDGIGGRKYGGDGHGCQHRVGNVIQEGADEPVVDLMADGDKGQYADQISGTGHKEQI